MSDPFAAGGPRGQSSPPPPDATAEGGQRRPAQRPPPRAQPQPPRTTPPLASHVRPQSLASATAGHVAALPPAAAAAAASTSEASQRWATLSQFYGTLPVTSPSPSTGVGSRTASAAPASAGGHGDSAARSRDEAAAQPGHCAASHPHTSAPHTPYTPPYTVYESSSAQGLYAAASPLLATAPVYMSGELVTASIDNFDCTLADPGTGGGGGGAVDGDQAFPLSHAQQQQQQQQQQHYDSNSQHSLYAAAQVYTHTAPPPPPQQQHPQLQEQQRRPSITTTTLAWTIPVPAGPGSPFSSSSLRSPIASSTFSATAAAAVAATAASLTSPTMPTYFAPPSAVSTPPAAGALAGSSARPAPSTATAASATTGAASMAWPSSVDPHSRVVVPQPPTSSRAPSSSAAPRPAMQPILIGHTNVNRDTAAILEQQQQQQQQQQQAPPQGHGSAAGDGAHAALQCLTSPLGLGSAGTTYYVEATPGSNSGSIGTSPEHSYVSMIALSRPLPAAQQQQQQQQQAQLPMENQPWFAQLVGQDGPISHFITRSPASMMSGVNSATPVNSSAAAQAAAAAAAVALGVAWSSGTTAELSGYSEHNSWAQVPSQPQQQPLLPMQHQHLVLPFSLNSARPCHDAQLIAAAAGPPQGALQPLNAPPSPPPSPAASQGRGIARRNRDRAVLFVGQLNYEATEADVSQVFGCYGKPLSVVVLKDKGKGGRRGGGGGGGGATAAQRKVGGSAFVTYASTLEADTAIMALHGRYNAKDDDPDNDDESKYLQVSYGQQTGLISTFGMRHAEKLHATKPENPIPFLAKEQKNKKKP